MAATRAEASRPLATPAAVACVAICARSASDSTDPTDDRCAAASIDCAVNAPASILSVCRLRQIHAQTPCRHFAEGGEHVCLGSIGHRPTRLLLGPDRWPPQGSPHPPCTVRESPSSCAAYSSSVISPFRVASISIRIANFSVMRSTARLYSTCINCAGFPSSTSLVDTIKLGRDLALLLLHSLVEVLDGVRCGAHLTANQ